MHSTRQWEGDLPSGWRTWGWARTLAQGWGQPQRRDSCRLECESFSPLLSLHSAIWVEAFPLMSLLWAFPSYLAGLSHKKASFWTSQLTRQTGEWRWGNHKPQEMGERGLPPSSPGTRTLPTLRLFSAPGFWLPSVTSRSQVTVVWGHLIHFPIIILTASSGLVPRVSVSLAVYEQGGHVIHLIKRSTEPSTQQTFQKCLLH